MATPTQSSGRPREDGGRTLPAELVDGLARAALAEDRGPGDLTSASCVPAAARARGELLAKAAGRLAGLAVFARVFELCDPRCRVELLKADGDAVAAGDVVARLAGPARALLEGERTALNFLQHLSGVATRTARLVERCAGRARVLDTRKTTPGLRALEKYAVLCGGGENHRMGLYDEVMIKDNHVELAGEPLEDLVRRARAAVGAGVRVTVEARDDEEALAAVRGGADVVLLDNMEPARMAALCPQLRELAGARALEIEASGGIDDESAAAVARSGVDRVSVGALTHSAEALDLSLRLAPAK